MEGSVGQRGGNRLPGAARAGAPPWGDEPGARLHQSADHRRRLGLVDPIRPAAGGSGPHGIDHRGAKVGVGVLEAEPERAGRLDIPSDHGEICEVVVAPGRVEHPPHLLSPAWGRQIGATQPLEGERQPLSRHEHEEDGEPELDTGAVLPA